MAEQVRAGFDAGECGLPSSEAQVLEHKGVPRVMVCFLLSIVMSE